jgi:hypothetical protein
VTSAFWRRSFSRSFSIDSSSDVDHLIEVPRHSIEFVAYTRAAQVSLQVMPADRQIHRNFLSQVERSGAGLANIDELLVVLRAPLHRGLEPVCAAKFTLSPPHVVGSPGLQAGGATAACAALDMGCHNRAQGSVGAGTGFGQPFEAAAVKTMARIVEGGRPTGPKPAASDADIVVRALEFTMLNVFTLVNGRLVQKK